MSVVAAVLGHGSPKHAHDMRRLLGLCVNHVPSRSVHPCPTDTLLGVVSLCCWLVDWLYGYLPSQTTEQAVTPAAVSLACSARCNVTHLAKCRTLQVSTQELSEKHCNLLRAASGSTE